MELGFTCWKAESMDITLHLCATLTDTQISRARVSLQTDWQHHHLQPIGAVLPCLISCMKHQLPDLVKSECVVQIINTDF